MKVTGWKVPSHAKRTTKLDVIIMNTTTTLMPSLGSAVGNAGWRVPTEYRTWAAMPIRRDGNEIEGNANEGLELPEKSYTCAPKFVQTCGAFRTKGYAVRVAQQYNILAMSLRPAKLQWLIGDIRWNNREVTMSWAAWENRFVHMKRTHMLCWLRVEVEVHVEKVTLHIRIESWLAVRLRDRRTSQVRHIRSRGKPKATLHQYFWVDPLSSRVVDELFCWRVDY